MGRREALRASVSRITAAIVVLFQWAELRHVVYKNLWLCWRNTKSSGRGYEALIM